MTQPDGHLTVRAVFTFVVTTLVDAATAKNKQEHIRGATSEWWVSG